ncbi:hypothetical protein D3C78_1327430 [compost metagenome]
MLGHDLSVADAVACVRQRFPAMPYCLVRKWVWIDLDVPAAVREELENAGYQPVMLYAHEVVVDSQFRFEPGDWVRSTPLYTFSEVCFFQTRNTVYVLLGHGTRKSATLSTMVKIF